jgi:hypothetical protein
MRKIVKKIVVYRCETCRTDYDRRSDALKCERSGVEKRAYRKGDLVRTRAQCPCGQRFAIVGFILKVTGPYAAGPESLLKARGLKPGTGHLYLYQVEACRCPKCKSWVSASYPAAHLEAGA